MSSPKKPHNFPDFWLLKIDDSPNLQVISEKFEK